MTSSRGDTWWGVYCNKIIKDGGTQAYELVDFPGVMFSQEQYSKIYYEWHSNSRDTTDLDAFNEFCIKRIITPPIDDPFTDMSEEW